MSYVCMNACYLSASQCRVILCIVVLASCFHITTCGLIAKPKNLAVLSGERMEMECRTDNEGRVAFWYFVSLLSATPLTVAQHDNRRLKLVNESYTRFGVDADHNGSGILYTNATNMNDAGLYRCEVISDGVLNKSSAQLIVFESEPKCKSNFSEKTSVSHDDVMWMQCVVKYKGNWTPTTEWRQHSRHEDNGKWTVLNDDDKTTISENSIINSTLTVVGSSVADGSFYSFKVYFKWENDSLRTDATNVPDFTYTWNSTIISTSGKTTVTSQTAAVPDTAQPFLYIALGAISILFLLFAVATIIVCVVISRNKRFVHQCSIIERFSRDDLNRVSPDQCQHCLSEINSASEVSACGNIFPNVDQEGYTSVEDLRDECSRNTNVKSLDFENPKLAVVEQEISDCCSSLQNDQPSTPSNIPKYSKAEKRFGASARSKGATYSFAKDDPLLYATIRKDIEPPKHFSDDEATDSDASN